jgi:hypothetical protein
MCVVVCDDGTGDGVALAGGFALRLPIGLNGLVLKRRTG